MIDAAACADVLRRAFPDTDVRVEAGRFGSRARTEVPDFASLQYLYLAPSSEGRVELMLYPADTLTQARAFWRDPRAPLRVLALREKGWRVEPNFHFGFMERGLTWVETRISVDAYADHWLKRAGDLASLDREDWSQFLEDLIANRVASEADRLQFDKDFTLTRRRSATPRPGLRVVFAWPGTRFGGAAFAKAVRERANDALETLLTTPASHT